MDTKFLDYCVEVGVLDSADLTSALATSEEGVSIYETLIRKQSIAQEQLAVAAGEFYNCPVVDLSRVSPEPQAIKYGTGVICRHLLFLPFVIDISAGLLVALADYALKERIIAYLKEMRVERMKFYIAPYETLRQSIASVYSSDNSSLSSSNSSLSSSNSSMHSSGQSQQSVQRRRKASILRTQCVDFDIASLRKDASSSSLNTSDERRIQAIAFELAACREENNQLRQRVEQLTSAVELESAMIRELARILKSTGSLDSMSFERWLTSLR